MYIYIYIYTHIKRLRSTVGFPQPGQRTLEDSAGALGSAENVCYSFSFLTQSVFPTSSWCLLRRWTGDPPETLSGLTSNPLSLMW